MSNTTQIQTPLAKSEPLELAGTHLQELPLSGKISLRGNSSNRKLAAAVKKATGLVLPTKANTFNHKGEGYVTWMGPNEWQITCELDQTNKLIDELRADLQDIHSAVVEVSDYYTTLQLSGPLARKVLANGSAFDTHPSQFNKGQCTQTRFGHAAILLQQLSAEPDYRIQIRWSYAQYLFDYLSAALHNHATDQ